MIKRILVALGDPEYSAIAIRRAIELAKSHQAEVTAVTAVHADRLAMVGPVPVGAAAAARDLASHRIESACEAIKEALYLFRSVCDSEGVEYQVEHEKGNPFDLAVSRSRYHDLMVCNLRHIFDDGVDGESPDAVVRLIADGVRPVIAVAPEYRTVHRVLIAYSGTMESAKAMKRFVQMRLWEDLHIRVVTYDRSADAARELLRDAASYCRAHGYDTETDHLSGPPVDGLLEEAASWNADMIVLGNSSRRLLLRRVFGETVLHLIRQSEVPLFLAQ